MIYDNIKYDLTFEIKYVWFIINSNQIKSVLHIHVIFQNKL